MIKDSTNVQDGSVAVVFSIGSNYGDRFANVTYGLNWLSNFLTHFKCSTIYATPDCHGGSREYLNAVAYGVTDISPQQIETICKKIELECGRDESMRNLGNVPLDIDLVVYESQILRPKDFNCAFFKIGYDMI